jgi:hypothetical protein
MGYPLKSQGQGDRLAEARITAIAFFAGLILATVLLAFRQKEVMFGIWAGTLLSILNFKLFARNTGNRFSPAKERFYQFFLKIVLRYGIMAVILWYAIAKDFRFFIGLVAGLFAIRFAMFVKDKEILPWRRNSTD